MRNILLLCLLLAGCGPTTLLNVQVEEEWAQEAVEGAVNFWALHGVQFTFDPDGTPIVMQDLPGALGAYFWAPAEVIYIDAEVRQYRSVRHIQVVAHELGHKLGMEHVEGDESLMSVNLTFCEGICWSEADQAEFSRALLGGE